MSNDSSANGCHASGQMFQPVNPFMLAIAVLWSLFTLFGVLLLLPVLNRRLLAWKARRKPGCRVPTYPQRIVFLLLTLLMTTVSFSSAFDRDLRSIIYISSGQAVCLIILLPMFYFALGLRKEKNG